MAEKVIFRGLSSLQDALEYADRKPEPKKNAPATSEEDNSEYAVQTREIQALADCSSAATEMLVEGKLALRIHPILFIGSFISDALEQLYTKYNLNMGWMYNQYRVLKNARLIGIRRDSMDELKRRIEGVLVEDEEIRIALAKCFDYEDSTFKDWTFIGKPAMKEGFVYWLIIPREIAQQNQSFLVKRWDFVE
jgi:hypothetical protein